MAKQAPEIVGFSVGGIMPLEQVGFIMKEILDRGGKLDLVQPFAEMRKPPAVNGHIGSANGVVGLLPAPAKAISGLTPKGEKRYKAMVETLQSAGPEGLRVKEIYAVLKKKGYSEFIVRDWLRKLTAAGEARETPPHSGFWHYGQAPMQTVAATAETSKYSPAVQTLLNAIASFGEAGGTRKQVLAVAKMKYWSMPHIKLLVGDGAIKIPERNRFIATVASPVAQAPGSAPAPAPISASSPTRDIIMAFVSQRSPTPQYDVVEHVTGIKKMTKASARQTMKRMVKDKELHKTATGMISIP